MIQSVSFYLLTKTHCKMFTFVVIVIVMLWLLVKWLKKDFNIFNERNVKFEKPVILFGNLFNAAMSRESIIDSIERLYTKFYDEK
jgi:dolichol kinase